LCEEILSLSFIDDANWISSSLEDMKDILSMVDEFYQITQAAINKDKSILLINLTKSTMPISIYFDNITIDLVLQFGLIKFLGVMINTYLYRSLIKKDL